MNLILLVLLIFLFVSELLYFKIADKYNIVDKPNERSSHKHLPIRGGGFIFYWAVLLWFVWSGFTYPFFIAGLTAISLISYLDDIKPRPYKIRLSVQFISIILLFFQLEVFSHPWYVIIVMLIVAAGMINVFNFMDGINGITGAYSLGFILSMLYINNNIISFIENELLYFVMMSLVVFLFFNFRKSARCFAGDVGAVAIAFVSIFLIARLIIVTGDISYMLLLVVYGVDTVLTIIHRIMLKENVSQPHRKHMFQIMANELKIPHLVVTAIYVAVQTLLTVGFFLLKEHSLIYLFIVAIVLILVYVAFMKKYFKLHKI